MVIWKCFIASAVPGLQCRQGGEGGEGEREERGQGGRLCWCSLGLFLGFAVPGEGGRGSGGVLLCALPWLCSS